MTTSQTVCLLLLAGVVICDGLQCNVLNTIQGLFVQQCPGNIQECMKFVCNNRGTKQYYKGCNDPGNPAVACATLQQNCMAQGGTGQCYTCNYELCNGVGAVSALLVTALSMFIFA